MEPYMILEGKLYVNNNTSSFKKEEMNKNDQDEWDQTEDNPKNRGSDWESGAKKSQNGDRTKVV
jgi:hypothetical protein